MKNERTIQALTDSAQYMLECEARFWIKCVREYGYAWWNARKDAIKKKRGSDGLQRLLDEMNRQRVAK